MHYIIFIYDAGISEKSRISLTLKSMSCWHHLQIHYQIIKPNMKLLHLDKRRKDTIGIHR